MIIIWLIVLAASLFVITKSADYFTDSSEKIGHLLKLPNFVTGILIVALGTSLPELITSIFAISKGEAGIVSANVIGSTIANIFLGLGLVVVLSKRIAKFNWDTVSNDMPFIFGSVILLTLTITDGVLKFYEALIFILGYVIYVIYSLRINKMNRKQIRDDLKKEIRSKQKIDFEQFNKERSGKKQIGKLFIIFFVSLFFVLFSAKYVVDSVIALATILGLATPALAASVIAIGTSLPEISVGISSARKGHFDMVIGNIMGSNIFNMLAVMGIVGLFTNITIPAQVINFILPMSIAAILIQWLTTIDKKITITEGLMMTLLYIAFIGKLFGLF
jgi:cation:H+ antiporter